MKAIIISNNDWCYLKEVVNTAIELVALNPERKKFACHYLDWAWETVEKPPHPSPVEFSIVEKNLLRAINEETENGQD